LQRRSNLTVIGKERLPLLLAGSRSTLENYRSDLIFDTHPPILPLITGGGPSLNKRDRSYRMYYQGGATHYYLYSIKSNGALSPTIMKHSPLG